MIYIRQLFYFSFVIKREKKSFDSACSDVEVN